MMKAFIVKRYGKKEKLHLAELEQPVVNEKDVLVQIHSAGVNVIDLLLRNGDFKLFLPMKPPFQLGRDVAGIVTKVGSKVSKFKIGDEVYSSSGNHHLGTYAEYISIDENEVALKPKNLSMEEAGSIPLVGLTAWQALVEIGKVKKGQKVFIQAGSGGVGTFAIQLAKHLGATVATTASAANAGLVSSLGADVVVDYKAQDFGEVLRGYDAVLNSQDGKTLEKSLQVLRDGGRLISISGPPDPTFAAAIKASGFVKLVIRLLSSGIRRRARSRGIDYSFLFMKASGSQLAELTRLIESGVIRPVIDKVFPFEATNEALAYVAAGRVKGKVVVKVK